MIVFPNSTCKTSLEQNATTIQPLHVSLHVVQLIVIQDINITSTSLNNVQYTWEVSQYFLLKQYNIQLSMNS